MWYRKLSLNPKVKESESFPYHWHRECHYLTLEDFLRIKFRFMQTLKNLCDYVKNCSFSSFSVPRAPLKMF